MSLVNSDNSLWFLIGIQELREALAGIGDESAEVHCTRCLLARLGDHALGHVDAHQKGRWPVSLHSAQQPAGATTDIKDSI